MTAKMNQKSYLVFAVVNRTNKAHVEGALIDIDASWYSIIEDTGVSVIQSFKIHNNFSENGIYIQLTVTPGTSIAQAIQELYFISRKRNLE